MSDRDCWIPDQQIRKELRAFFHDVSRHVAQYLSEHPSTQEPHLDGHLVNCLSRGRFARFDRRIKQYASRKGIAPLCVDFDARHVTADEARHGADLGLIAGIDVPGQMKITKAVLVQSKRLHPDDSGQFSQSSKFPELFKRAGNRSSQWDRMLRVTPASVFLFQGPDRLYIDRSFKEFGLRVVAARRIKGMASAGERELTARDCFHISRDFGRWMVDQFICCNQGDSAKQAIATALGDNPDLPVHHSIRLEIRRDDSVGRD